MRAQAKPSIGRKWQAWVKEVWQSPSLDERLATHFGTNSHVAYRLDRTMHGFAVGQQAAAGERQELLQSLAQPLRDASFIDLPGHCRACGRDSNFRLDRLYASGDALNWRERLVCSQCELNHRLRLCADLFDGLNRWRDRARVYITEQVTPAFRVFEPRCRLVGSEFLGPDVEPGDVVNGVRHEDCTRLSFGPASFDMLMSYDVLEHIPQADRAISEFARVLRRGGVLLLTVPFMVQGAGNRCRATLADDGSITHLAPPEYHGDPVQPERGILCFWHFGWELLAQLRAAGFADAALFSAWSREAGYLGPPSPVIVAVR